MKSIIAISFRKVVSFATRAIAEKYLQKDRNYTYKNLKLKVFKGVFHPGLFRSTKVFASWIEQQELQHKNVLEIGSGSGLLSLVAAGKGAVVTAVDINPAAVENTKLNAAANELNVTVILSDLFSELHTSSFDFVFINPPYYPKHPHDHYEKAWYCGEDFEYFTNLFGQLRENGLVENCYMILSDTCDLSFIKNIALIKKIQLVEVYRKKVSGELLIVYKTSRVSLAESYSEG